MTTGRGSRLLAEQRRRKILELIEQKGQITVRELVERFAVSSVTARGDLDDLCLHGLAVRSHGGAVRNLESSANSAPHSKERLLFAEVARLAKEGPTTVSRATAGGVPVAPPFQARASSIPTDERAKQSAHKPSPFFLPRKSATVPAAAHPMMHPIKAHPAAQPMPAASNRNSRLRYPIAPLMTILS